MKSRQVVLRNFSTLCFSTLFYATVFAQGKLETVEIYQELQPGNKDPNEMTLRIMDIWHYAPSSEVMDRIQKRLGSDQNDYYAATEEEILAGKTLSGAQIGDHTRYLLPETSIPSDAVKYRIDRLPHSGSDMLRVSIASGVRILVPQGEGKPPKYLLLANRSSAKKGVLRYGPVGGAYEVDDKSMDAWRKMMQPLATAGVFVPEEGPFELRFKAQQSKIPMIVEAAMHHKEYTPYREIVEEMVAENPVIPKELMNAEARGMQVQVNPRQPYSTEEIAAHANGFRVQVEVYNQSITASNCEETLARIRKAKP